LRLEFDLGMQHVSRKMKNGMSAEVTRMNAIPIHKEKPGADISFTLLRLKEKLGADHPDTLTSMVNLAEAYRNQGQLDKAEELSVQVVEIQKEKLGADHPDALTAMANLAATYSQQGRQDKAEELLVQVMEIRKEKLGANHPSTLTSLNNLA